MFGGSIGASYVARRRRIAPSWIERYRRLSVIDVKVSICDGKEHPVDSKDVAFQKAGRERSSRDKARPSSRSSTSRSRSPWSAWGTSGVT